MSWTDSQGFMHDCPHPAYGHRIPTHEDIRALTQLFNLLGSENAMLLVPMLSQVIASYCLQFYGVTAPEQKD